MKNRLKNLVLRIIAISFIINPTLAFTTKNLTFTNHFSPYADLTLDAVWNSQYENMEPRDLSKISQDTGIKSFHLAFITDAGTCQPAWGAQESYSVDKKWGVHLTDKLRENNIDYIISLGGASGNDLSKACTKSQLIAAYLHIIKIYNPAGLDFDIENGTADVNKVMRAIKEIQFSYPKLKISFTLPVLPEGLVSSGIDILNQAKENDLNYTVNIMAMDYGPAYTNDMGEYAIQAATNLFNTLHELYPAKSTEELWKMIEVTPMIGVNDVSTEQFTLTNVDTLRNFAFQNHLGGLSMWSISRDTPCADKWASPICTGNNLQSQPYEFAKRFMEN